MLIRRSIRGVKKNLYKMGYFHNLYTIMNLLPDVDNFLELNVFQRAVVLRMASISMRHQAVWPLHTDVIVREAIAFRVAQGLHVFPHMEIELLDEEDEPPVPPGTPEIRDLRAPE